MVSFSEAVPRLPTLDLEKSVSFYCQALGFDLSLLWPDRAPTFAILRRDRVEIQFFTFDQDPGENGGSNKGIGDVTLSFDVDDALSMHDQLRGLVPVEWGPEVYSYGRRVFAFRDPNDYLIIVSEPTEDLPTCIVE